MRSRSCWKSILLSCSAILVACGRAGSPTPDVVVTNEPAGANCAAGGKRIQIPSPAEGPAVAYVCNALKADKATDVAIVDVATEPPGANCAAGGIAITSVSGGSAPVTWYACNGVSPKLIATAEAPGADCRYGGVKLQAGTSAPTYVCSGAPGAAGESVTTSQEPPGAQCANGGAKLQVGSAAPTYVCNGATGPAGVNGQSVSLSPEAPGSNCANGGVKVQVGTSPAAYFCNGTNGAPGLNGQSVTMADEPAGVNCASGGVKLAVGAGPATYVCSGARGADGQSVAMTPEPPGEHCRDGGVRLQVGTSSPTYACNGAADIAGQSVALAVEPPGAHCANGGVRLQVGSDPPAYVCSGGAVATGAITGKLTYRPQPSVSPLPASNVTVSDITLAEATGSTTTDASGTFTLAGLAPGVHTLTFSGAGWATLQVDGISVLAGKTAVVDRLLTATNPIVIVPAVASAPAGFGAPSALNAAVSGGTSPYSYRWTAAASNPTPVTLSASTAASPTFTTGTLAAVLAAGKVVGFGKVTSFDVDGHATSVADPQVRFLGIGAQQLAQLTYNFTVTVTDASGFVRSATVSVPTATLAQGNGVVPLGQIIVANLPGNTVEAVLTRPEGSAAVLNEAGTTNPWFIPDVAGNYAIAVGGTVLEVNASAYTSANPSCGNCHLLLPQAQRDDVAAKFKDWANSAHGNHFFKYMHYDAGGALVWNTDAVGNLLPAPTANPFVSWSAPGAMSTFEFGMTGAEGLHYGSSCTTCHTTGANALARNGGFTDVAAASGWAFPGLAGFFTSLTGPTSSTSVVNGAVVTSTHEQVTAAPTFGAWDAIPDAVKAYAGVQCESCHGPLGGHREMATKLDGTTFVKPVQEFDVAACAACHDRPANHDRVALWRQSRHANMDVALADGAGVSAGGGSAAPRASCNRCHSAQGFVQYLNQLTGNLRKPDGTPVPGAYPGNLVDPSRSPLADASVAYLQGLGITADCVQPQTCQTCHDPHTTRLRVEGDTPALPGGFKVVGAGAGAICFVCHNSRNGARGDAANGVYTNNSNPGTPVSVTSIGAPHDSDQGDVVAGRNAFFVGAYHPSAHLAIQDTCVGCHMRNFPAGMTGTSTNHAWRVDATICASCHGGAKDPVDGVGLQRQFDDAMDDVAAALSALGQATVRAVYYKGSKRTVQIPADAIAQFVSGRSPGFVLTFPSPLEDPNSVTGTITTLGSAGSPAGLGNFYSDAGATTKVFDVLKGTFAKANWNYSLLQMDGSRGVHNPSFAFDVLSATIAALHDSALPR